MGFRSQSGGRHGSGEKFQRSAHEKAKPKTAKKRPGIQYADETEALPAAEVVKKTLASLEKLGNQKFALSPFSQYYDDWFVNLRQVVSGFEANPAVGVDEAFEKARTSIFVEVESELAKLRIRETDLESSAQSLSNNNHFLVELDVIYAGQTRELGLKRNDELEPLKKNVHDLEEEIAKIRQTRTKFFGFTKRAKQKKEAEATQRLNAAKTELQMALENFGVEQDKLHDEYTRKKQETMGKIRSLEVAITNIETDASAEPRAKATAALADAVKVLAQRKAAAPNDVPAAS
jgi:hypothetical protein